MIKKSNRGFGLLELLIVLSIIGILALIALPAFTTFIQKNRLSGVAETLYYNLQYARTEAIKRNANVYVSFSTGDNWCYGINVGSACDCTVSGNCSIATIAADNPQQISLSATGYASNYVYFEGSHGAAQASGSLTMTVYQQTTLIKISIGSLGNLQICSTGVGGYTAC